MTTEIQKLIRQTYGSITHFAKMIKVSRPTAHTYFKDPTKIPFGTMMKICRHAKINIKQFIQQSIQEDIYE